MVALGRGYFLMSEVAMNNERLASGRCTTASGDTTPCQVTPVILHGLGIHTRVG